MSLFKQKYRIESTRLQGWDYATAGWYFVTICTKDRCWFFGEVVGEEMPLSPVGEIVAAEWHKTAELRPNVALDQWVVMPNHLHGIIVIKDATDAAHSTAPDPAEAPPLPETPHRGVSTGPRPTGRDVPVGRLGGEVGRRLGGRLGGGALGSSGARVQGLTSGSLGAILGQFKSVCTKRIWQAGYPDFAWQARFYDHIIRDDESLRRIRQYIVQNPAQWALDQDNPENLYM